jgi:hypothetical protein
MEIIEDVAEWPPGVLRQGGGIVKGDKTLL